MSHAEQAGPAPETNAEADDLCDEPARSVLRRPFPHERQRWQRWDGDRRRGTTTRQRLPRDGPT
jgi:hypothetical protein